MNRAIRMAMTLSTTGMLLAILCLIKTTPVTMTVFSFIGVPLFLAGGAVYLSQVFQAFRRSGLWR